MNKILTNSIVDPSIQQPFTGPSLEFLQLATNNMIDGLNEALIGAEYDISIPYIQSGIRSYGTNQYTQGYFYFNSEMFYCPGKTTTTPFTNIPVCTIMDIADTTADPLTFTDGNQRSVHRNRYISIVDGATGSGSFDLSSAFYVPSIIKTKIIDIGDWNMDSSTNVTLAHGLSDFTKVRNVSCQVRNDGNTTYYNLMSSINNGLGTQVNEIAINSSNVILQRESNGIFDNSLFDSTSYNRGWVTIQYII